MADGQNGLPKSKKPKREVAELPDLILYNGLKYKRKRTSGRPARIKTRGTKGRRPKRYVTQYVPDGHAGRAIPYLEMLDLYNQDRGKFTFLSTQEPPQALPQPVPQEPQIQPDSANSLSPGSLQIVPFQTSSFQDSSPPPPQIVPHCSTFYNINRITNFFSIA